MLDAHRINYDNFIATSEREEKNGECVVVYHITNAIIGLSIIFKENYGEHKYGIGNAKLNVVSDRLLISYRTMVNANAFAEVV